jgi:hypothetical protein
VEVEGDDEDGGEVCFLSAIVCGIASRREKTTASSSFFNSINSIQTQIKTQRPSIFISPETATTAHSTNKFCSFSMTK